MFPRQRNQVDASASLWEELHEQSPVDPDSSSAREVITGQELDNIDWGVYRVQQTDIDACFSGICTAAHHPGLHEIPVHSRARGRLLLFSCPHPPRSVSVAFHGGKTRRVACNARVTISRGHFCFTECCAPTKSAGKRMKSQKKCVHLSSFSRQADLSIAV